MKTKFYILLWSIYGIVVVYFGLTSLSDSLRGLSKPAKGSYATTDVSLDILEVRKPSEKVRSVLARLPENSAILFVGPKDDPRFILTFYVVNYLAWPHQVGYVGCRTLGETPEVTTLPSERQEVRSLLYFKMQPPAWLPNGDSIGPKLTLIPITEVRDWMQYCSQ
jgi:hypothetical protein